MLPWAVRRTRLPLLTLPCVDCPSERADTGDGRFRVNANGKLLDVWLLVNCVACDRTSRLTVHHRVAVRSLPADRLAGYTTNAPSLVAEILLDPSTARRGGFGLDWEGCWELHAPPPPETPWPLRVEVAFDAPVAVRPDRLIAQGLGMSRNEVVRRVKSDVPLNRPTKRGFSFVLV
ncbi:hypothetical protein DFP74_5056 [Nocardiopsis sp. Huas11]|uniref:DUF1062 domain-containing protein n=1 Tax=Nocardiopsis sp. Huas11 TaxID=2183912 RepID=UPI000F180CE7|nr:DUF1062 domain-containing protein [Nocardiopsis sp. Huas11]RKS09321.1 hypothetical protein DFP74_5056 [Nocardiopsis sp. Huas11]